MRGLDAAAVMCLGFGPAGRGHLQARPCVAPQLAAPRPAAARTAATCWWVSSGAYRRAGAADTYVRGEVRFY